MYAVLVVVPTYRHYEPMYKWTVCTMCVYISACIYLDVLSDGCLESLRRASCNEKWNGCERGTEKISEWRGVNGVLVGKYLAKFSFSRALAEWLNI